MRLFSPHAGDGKYLQHHHLAQMVSLMGPSPRDSLQRSEKCAEFWDDLDRQAAFSNILPRLNQVAGNWKSDVPVPTDGLGAAEQRL